MLTLWVKVRQLKNKGFTLIELMVAVAIISITLTLVGPNLYKTYQKAKYQTDMIKLRENLKAISRKAFLNNRAVKLILNKHKIQYQYVESKKPFIEKSFANISFPHQSIFISASGFIDKLHLTITLGKKEKLMNLSKINAL